MNIFFLCGVTEAGKSTTIRHSIEFLNVDSTTKLKFRNNQNTPKIIEVNGKIVCIYLDSPQEASFSPDEAIEYLRDKIEKANVKNADLLVLGFNISQYHDNKTEACLNWIESKGYKPVSYFTYLDSDSYFDTFARDRFESIKLRKFNTKPKILRTTCDEQGKIFAKYIIDLL